MATITMLSTTRRAAHGLHRCGDCGGRIAARDHYRDSRVAGDGTVWTWREHALCSALGDWWQSEYPYAEPEEFPVVCTELLAEWWREFVVTFGGVLDFGGAA